MGISRDHLEKIELKLKTERGWRDGLIVNSACGPSGDTNFTPPYSYLVSPNSLQLQFQELLNVPLTSRFFFFFKRGVFSRPKGGHGFVFAGMRV